jgi:hypothetical protein
MDLEPRHDVCAPLRDPGFLACSGTCLGVRSPALRGGIDTSRSLVHQIAEDLRAGKVEEVIARLRRLRPKTAELRESLQALIGYYRENATRMRYDEYLRLGYGMGSGAVESAHKQVVHARLRQAGMRWSEAGARRLLALRLLLLNDNWALLDRMRMVSVA